ncbi:MULTISPECIES: DUF4238 domain-containing protein [unclassified Paenibacillus]|uniref:DUF4238 domain-containing protein n=1 Tax=unclassified Paenibacillus TaxID=185978 RepID=UPI00020D7855|nr:MULTISPECIES: DUF4238 domain-containing protein [unclassified Paenibacillus]EGL19829.1 hypothetical protein HMPREF9413_4825 [Paenibacillus sp. HGF7]EPD81318.1 hypothetical protein HMPREF1207_05075 [Paenibacillus sp. HGH0039]
MSNITKNQHYIPQSILSNFANNKGKVFEILLKNMNIYSVSYRQSMSERFTYEHPYLEDNYLEKKFGTLESYFAPAMRKIIESIESDSFNIQDIKKQSETYMRDFLIFYYRSGALLNEYTLGGLQKEDKIPLLLEKIFDSKYLIELSNTIIKHYDFSIIKSEEDGFLLSDQYVSTCALSIKGQYANLSNRHLGLKDVLILIPLSSKYYITYFNGKKPHYINSNAVNILSGDQVREINTSIINNSYIKCIGAKRESIELVKEAFKFESPSKAIMVYESGRQIAALNKKEVFFYDTDIEQWSYFRNLHHTKNFHTKRNDICNCGSGKKYKRCCLTKTERNYSIVNNMYKEGHHIKIRVHSTAILEKPLDEYTFV